MVGLAGGVEKESREALGRGSAGTVGRAEGSKRKQGECGNEDRLGCGGGTGGGVEKLQVAERPWARVN